MRSLLFDRPFKPILAWQGSKQNILGEILNEIYATNFTGTYYEPFIGGGSVLLALQPERAVINDLNMQLVNLWRCVAEDVDTFKDAYCACNPDVITKEDYYTRRDEHNQYRHDNTTGFRAAAIFVWCVKSAFNGQYRVGKNSGNMNATWDWRKKQTPMLWDNLRDISRYLRENDVTIMCGDFESAISTAKEGDLIYADPPYGVGTKEPAYSCNTYGGFDIKNDSARVARVLTDAPCHVVASNNDNDYVRELYPSDKWKRKKVLVRRNFHSSIGRIDYSRRPELIMSKR